MVGSRAASYEGQKAAKKIARELSSHGTGIVSGMAGGIDTASHAGCMEGGSPTIAVTGCGLDIVYPAVNALFGLLFRMLRKEVVIVFVKQFFDFLCQEEDGDDVRDNHH